MSTQPICLILGLYVLDEIDDTGRVAVLVVVPRDKLDELVIQWDTSLGIKDAGVGITDEVRRDDVILSVSQDSVERSTGGSGFLYLGLDLVVGRGLAQTNGKIDDRDVGNWHTEGHTGELAVQSGNDFADGLSGTSGGRDDVLGSTTAITPQLLNKRVFGLVLFARIV